ncbi:MAG: SDR family oxidoreductase [Gemmatimonadetes bacterium]|nr:SDR family oxidoreductase [Gemmatimonadota bacterium]
MEIEGRIALVTGAARRVGRALALGLARAGADVLVHHHRSVDDAATAVREIEALGRRAVAVPADLERAEDIAGLAGHARAEFGRLDVLVNSAARFERAAVSEITEADWDRVIGVNLKAPFFLTRALLPLLRPGGGVVVNIADLSAVQAWPSFAHHAVSKAGLVHLTRVLARALGPEIRVNCIVAGTVIPAEDHQGDDDADRAVRRIVGRPGDPQDVVDALLYLVRSDFVTGEIVTVDGGRRLL